MILRFENGKRIYEKYDSIEEEVDYAVSECLNKPKFRVMIAAYSEQRKYIMDYAIKKLGNNIIQGATRNNELISFIAVKNGSAIKAMPVAESSRGQFQHMLIVDENVNDEDIIRNVFMVRTFDYDKWRGEE